MKKFLAIIFVLYAVQVGSNATLYEDHAIQQRINNIGCNILNKNKITKRIIFVYDKSEKTSKLKTNKTLTKRQIIVYKGMYEQTASDDELAAMLSREISTALKSYSGIWGGTIDSLQVSLSSKKFETVADERAVDYMVNSGYNPLALIVYVNKTCPQMRQDLFSRHNLTSKRLARIYEYITYKYPHYLSNNEYIENKYYQNFLLTSLSNRQKLEEKIKSGSKKDIKYE